MERNVGLPSDEEYFTLWNGDRVPLSELMLATDVTLNPGPRSKPSRKYANPTPIGMAGFGMSQIVFSVINFHGQGVKLPHVMVGLALFYGGLVSIIAGIWEIVVENTFSAVTLLSYGGMWCSWAVCYIPGFGIISAYSDVPKQLTSGLGFFFLLWTLFTWGMWLCTFKSTLAIFMMFLLLGMSQLLLAISNFGGSRGCQDAGGIIGIIAGVFIWYIAYSGVASKDNSYFSVRSILLPGAVGWRDTWRLPSLRVPRPSSWGNKK